MNKKVSDYRGTPIKLSPCHAQKSLLTLLLESQQHCRLTTLHNTRRLGQETEDGMAQHQWRSFTTHTPQKLSTMLCFSAFKRSHSWCNLLQLVPFKCCQKERGRERERKRCTQYSMQYNIDLHNRMNTNIKYK